MKIEIEKLDQIFLLAKAETANQYTTQTCVMEDVNGKVSCPICFFTKRVRELIEVRDSLSSLAASPQPHPKQSNIDIYPLVLSDIKDRVEAGRHKYGVVLQAHNGRKALWDLYQELIDAVMYIRQEIEEQKNV